MDIKKILRESQTQKEAKPTSELSGVRPSHHQHPIGYDPRGFINLNMLALSSEQRKKCELCNNLGSLQCEQCMVTYYCTIQHFNMDKDTHAETCQKLKALRGPMAFSSQRETRERQIKQRQIHMNDLFLSSCRKSKAALDQGHYDEAIPAATVATTYAQTRYGQNEEMITPMMVAAECYLNKGNIRLAEGFIARALNIELNRQDIRPSIKAKIRHNEGLLAMARDDFQEALVDFAEEIYLTAEEYGPIHRKTTVGFCYLGRLFHQNREFDKSNSLFRQVVEIWTDFLEPILEEMTAESIVPSISGMKPKEIVWIEDLDRFDAEQILTHCYTNQRECFMCPAVGVTHVTEMDLARTCYARCILYIICKRPHEAETNAAEAAIFAMDQHRHEVPFAKKLQRVTKLAARMMPQAETSELRPHIAVSSAGSQHDYCPT